MGHKKRITIGVALLALTGAATANASETAQIRFGSGAFAINPNTCKFLHTERDYPLGSSWLEGKIAFAYEDQRHDTKLSCLTQKVDTEKTPKPSTDPCWAQVGAPPAVTEKADHGAGKPGDEVGAAALSAWAGKLYTCEQAENPA